jgi:hypothetical protein
VATLGNFWVNGKKIAQLGKKTFSTKLMPKNPLFVAKKSSF